MRSLCVILIPMLFCAELIHAQSQDDAAVQVSSAAVLPQQAHQELLETFGKKLLDAISRNDITAYGQLLPTKQHYKAVAKHPGGKRFFSSIYTNYDEVKARWLENFTVLVEVLPLAGIAPEALEFQKIMYESGLEMGDGMVRITEFQVVADCNGKEVRIVMSKSSLLPQMQRWAPNRDFEFNSR